MGYFADYADQIDFQQFGSEGIKGVRSCQAGGFWGVKSHFTAYEDEPALVSMPTGSGKTALMMLLAFGLSEKQVLIVTASDVLRTQTAAKFERLDGLRQAGVVDDKLETPSVATVTSRVTDEEMWDELDEDVVVTLPHNISKVYDSDQYPNSIVSPPEEKFDLVFFDEAHHIRAPSWMELLEAVDSAKRVLLTATPFRRDRQTLPGRMVYHYPLSNAMEEQLYQPLSLTEVSTYRADDPDRKLATMAATKLADIRTDYSSAKLLIRCDHIDTARDLETIYSNQDLEVEAIHSDRTSKQNAETISALREGDIDGVVAVGMLGEGVDIADLKVAVLHQPPKSFAFTLQLIGRVTRPAENADVAATVIADPDKLREAGVDDVVKRLYHEDAGWRQLVPELVDKYIETNVAATTAGQDALRGVNEQDLQPYRSTRLYESTESDVDLIADISLDDDTIVYKLPRSDEVFLGLITEQIDKPTWGTRTPLEYREYDLHLYYYHDGTETLFEASSSDELSNRIRSQIVSDEIELYGGESLVRMLQAEVDIEYQVAGLANALGPSGSLPSYKMYLGDRVEGAVRQTDAQAFAQGHAVAEVDEEIIGISNDQGRVWSTGREGIDDFISWCQELVSKLERYEFESAAPKLGLGEISRIDEFPAEPVYGTHNPALQQLNIEIDTSEVYEEGGWQPMKESALRDINYQADEPTAVEFSYTPKETAQSLSGTYNIADNKLTGQLANCQFRIDSGDKISKLTGEVFFNRYPLYFCTGDGTLVYNGRGHKVKQELSKVPPSCFVDESKIDWSGCATWGEYSIDDDDTDGDGLIHVHAWVEDFIEGNGESEQVLFRDHSSGEIADYVQFEPSEKRISLYHCKACKKSNKSGARLEDVRDVVDQVFRSIAWIRNSRLPKRIRYRQENTGVEGFKLNEEAFDEIETKFQPNEWSFRVYIVQPGLDHDKARSSNNTNTLLLTCKEWLEAVDTELYIIGDPNDQVVEVS
ncbi:DEAD/DEAH box helicase family protein (plasmid) [Halorussus salilacus]|uniref:DEAD/DEAH box helicase n=1 Tax=Halorussus salilacus TaxID=2953750 RepID=UPI00209D0030|nr:DEAD/DEAH box helicase family protein [Halorussus salilacus]USZ70036.1 DEAD/DEAH box helicase family protein [Halorussus salilacus]